MSIQELLSKRYATKSFDSSKAVSEADLNYILECARLSCSSFNTEPWKFVVITNPDLRKQLRAVSWDQAQVTEASVLIVVSTVKDPMTRVNKIADMIGAAAGADKGEGYRKMVSGSMPGSEAEVYNWMSRQVYLPLQAMILAAMERGIDSCPMEGFDRAKYAEILGMTDANPTVLLTLGYATEPGHPKLRVPMEDLVEYRK